MSLLEQPKELAPELTGEYFIKDQKVVLFIGGYPMGSIETEPPPWA